MDVLFFLTIIGALLVSVPVITIIRREPIILELRRKRMIQSARFGMIGIALLAIAAFIAAIGAFTG